MECLDGEEVLVAEAVEVAVRDAGHDPLSNGCGNTAEFLS